MLYKINVLKLVALLKSLESFVNGYEDKNKLDEFLNVIPLYTNYVCLETYSLFTATTVSFRRFACWHKSTYSIRQHVEINNLNDACMIVVTSDVFEMYVKLVEHEEKCFMNLKC